LGTHVFAQLDTVHFLPPFHARFDQGRHYLYLSTPEQTAFPVFILTGDGAPFVDGNGDVISSVMVSNSAPQIVYIGNGGNPLNAIITLTTNNELNTPISHKGIILEGAKPFYANFRARSADQAGSLTCKGRSALGTAFRVGHVYNESVPNISWPRRSNFVSMMATEDNTEVTISDFAAGMTFMSGGGDFPPPSTILVTLQKGESYVISTYVEANRPPQNNNGLQGALITSNYPIVVNTGSWLGSPFTNPLQDIGIDQIVPIDRVGDTYITIRGDGPGGLETPVIVATENNTAIFLQGNTIPVATIQQGQFFRVPVNSYSAEENLFIQASHPVYVYQMLGGANLEQTGGMNFVPPLRCAEGGLVDNIIDIDQIGNTTYDGKIILIAEKGKPVWINNGLIPANQLRNVTGNNAYVTYKSGGLTGNIKVESSGALQVGMFGRNNNAGWTGYFSGFDDPPMPNLDITTSKTCVDTIFTNQLTNVDSLFWYYNDNIIPGYHDTLFANPQPGNYQVIAKREFCDTLLWDTSDIIVVPIPLSVHVDIDTITCPGSINGGYQIEISEGGSAPYQISFDGGMTFGNNFSATGLDTGYVTYIIRDSLGCVYNDVLYIPLIPDLPILDIQSPDTLNCVRSFIQIDIGQSDTGSEFVWAWSSAEGHIIPDPASPEVTITQPGTYLLTLTKLSNQCSVDASILVPIDTLSPEVLVEGLNEITCRDTTILITLIAPPDYNYVYNWAIDPGLITVGMTMQEAIIRHPGTYYVTITDLINGCTAIEPIEIKIDTLAPSLILSNPDTLTCTRDSITLWLEGPLSPNFNYIWLNQEQDTLEVSADNTLKVAKAGIYKAIILNILNGCHQEVMTEVPSYLNQPLVSISNPSAITCKTPTSTMVALTDNCEDCSGVWISVQGNSYIVIDSLTLETSTPGSYIFLWTDTLSKCQAADTVTVTAIPPPESFEVQTTHPNCITNNGTILITNVEGGQPPFGYSFDNGITFGTIPLLTADTSGTYQVMLKDANDCVLLDSVTIEEIILPEIDLLSFIEIEWGTSVTLNPVLSVPLNTINSYLWTPADYLSCHTCPSPIATPLQNTDYTLTVVDTNGCIAVATVRIQLDLNVDVYVPNAFSPDNNGLNDGFTAYGDPAKIELINYLRIFDRWGNAVFEREVFPINDSSYGWDGRFRGALMDPAVFVYVLEVLFKNGETSVLKGDVNLLR
jgi:gliding motility-associated-like protein